MQRQAHQSGRNQRNSHQWRQVADFLDSQFLASLGLRLLSQESAARNCGERHAQRAAVVLREAPPVGNTGITSEVAK
ncbi:MAG: hypothetical protein Q7T10_01870 [Rhodoferax sp.]|uniref:hypothetical protein n=1 Tax=Rhodoferax sp. TaxID=50421 RepID=UPI0027276B73|nr:hypothetical protein [Rhodoferax sp.]MDO8447537.1 hypothetical protein [Rhodoferax sp.]